MSKVSGCILVALATAGLIIIDILSIAPAWSIYMEELGVVLALWAAVLYYLHHNEMINAGKEFEEFDENLAN
ncbi:MAG: hypothetical protein HQ503_05725 [Rhodospirillales bacterium]|nr:hypothetical protein [Rhodospirillales bacterium]